MPSDDQQTDDAFSFRLAWPDGQSREEEDGGSDESPAGSNATSPTPGPPEAEPDHEAQLRSSPPGSGRPTTTGQQVAPVQANAERVARLVVEAYDRLGGQVSGELRGMQADLDVDLAALRGELASLRASIGDVAERVQLRQLRSAVDELRGDITALRRAVVEAPELEQVSGDMASLRAAMVDLLETQAELSRGIAAVAEDPPDGAGEVQRGLEALRGEIHTVRSLVEGMQANDVDAVVEEVRNDVGALRGVSDGLAAGVRSLGSDVAELGRHLGAITRQAEGAPRASDLSGLRSDVAMLRDQLDALATAQARRQSEDRLAVASMTPLIEELTALRSEVEALRRRSPVNSARALTPADLERELDAAFERHRRGGV